MVVAVVVGALNNPNNVGADEVVAVVVGASSNPDSVGADVLMVVATAVDAGIVLNVPNSLVPPVVDTASGEQNK